MPSSRSFSWLGVVLVLAAVSSLLATGAGASDSAAHSGRHEAAEALTQRIVALEARHRRAGAPAKAGVLGELNAVAAERQELLRSLIEDDPAQVLRVALPAALRARAPASLRPFLEARVRVEGTLEAVYEDSVHTSRLRYSLHARGRHYSLHFASAPPALTSGARVRVEGVDVAGALALAPGESSTVVLDPGMEPASAAERRAIVLLVNFTDDPSEPFSLEEATQTVYGDTSDFLLESSFGRTWLTGDAAGWYTLPMSTGCSGSAIADAANQAAGISPSAYDTLIYVFPRNSSCGWSGMATVGGSPGKVWINGHLNLQVVGHEIGHNLGLYHSHGLECGGARSTGDCQSVEYGDRLDIMGFSRAHLGAYQKERLGWLGAGGAFPIVDADAEGTYTLDAYEAASGSGAKALRILKSVDPVTGLRTWYYLEYRQAIGFDDFLANNTNVLNGVLIRTASEASANSSFLLDMTPASASGTVDFLDPALVVGDSFAPPDGDLALTTVWADGMQAAVAVAFASDPCVRADPSIDLSPSESQWVPPATSVAFTLSVTNHDGGACGSSGFDLEASVPAGWTADLATPSVTLAPGGSASATVEVRSAVDAADGFYTVGATARHGADASRTATALGTYVVSTDATNGAPTPGDDSVTASPGVSLVVDVLANDSDPENDVLALVSVTQGSKGSVVVNSDATVTYTSGSKARGSDSFTYTVTDGGRSASATVAVTLQKAARGKPGRGSKK